MRDVSKAVLEAGVVDPETTKLLERWGLIGAATVAERPDLLEALVEIERLVGRERGAFRVTELDLDLGRYDPGVFMLALHTDETKLRGTCWYARVDGPHLLVGRNSGFPHLPEEGDSVSAPGPHGKIWKILSTEKLYEGQTVVAVRCETKEVEPNGE
jgi:hypothetical protein